MLSGATKFLWISAVMMIWTQERTNCEVSSEVNQLVRTYKAYPELVTQLLYLLKDDSPLIHQGRKFVSLRRNQVSTCQPSTPHKAFCGRNEFLYVLLSDLKKKASFGSTNTKKTPPRSQSISNEPVRLNEGSSITDFDDDHDPRIDGRGGGGEDESGARLLLPTIVQPVSLNLDRNKLKRMYHFLGLARPEEVIKDSVKSPPACPALTTTTSQSPFTAAKTTTKRCRKSKKPATEVRCRTTSKCVTSKKPSQQGCLKNFEGPVNLTQLFDVHPHTLIVNCCLPDSDQRKSNWGGGHSGRKLGQRGKAMDRLIFNFKDNLMLGDKSDGDELAGSEEKKKEEEQIIKLRKRSRKRRRARKKLKKNFFQ